MRNRVIEDDCALPHFSSTASVESSLLTPPPGHMVKVLANKGEAKKRKERRNNNMIFMINSHFFYSKKAGIILSRPRLIWLTGLVSKVKIRSSCRLHF
jgi:hypothetical protein